MIMKCLNKKWNLHTLVNWSVKVAFLTFTVVYRFTAVIIIIINIINIIYIIFTISIMNITSFVIIVCSNTIVIIYLSLKSMGRLLIIIFVHCVTNIISTIIFIVRA